MIEISKETLRSLLGQIESDLHASEVYQRTLAELHALLGEAAESGQLLIKAVGREAIRLALGQFAKHYKIVATASEETPANNPKQQSASPRLHVPEDTNRNAALETNSFPFPHQNNREPHARTTAAAYSVRQAPSPIRTSTPPAFTKPNKKLTKAEKTAQIAEQERQKLLCQIGQQLRQARLSRSLTVQQLHTRTLVPLHQIEALETGRFEELAEDVYLRGFIRRIGYALNLDGVAMAASLPDPDPVKSVVPSWYRSSSAAGFSAAGFSAAGFHLSPVHLYFGYAALVAGAVGGLSYLSQQSTPREPIELNPAPSFPPSVSPSNRTPEPAVKPGLKSSKTGVKAGPDIAPPEAL